MVKKIFPDQIADRIKIGAHLAMGAKEALEAAISGMGLVAASRLHSPVEVIERSTNPLSTGSAPL